MRGRSSTDREGDDTPRKVAPPVPPSREVLLRERKFKLAAHFEDGLLAALDECGVFGEGGNQDGHGDGRIALHADHAGVVRDFPPALSFFEGAAGKPAKVRCVNHDLNGILMAFGRFAQEGRGDFRLLHKVFRRTSSKIDHAAGSQEQVKRQSAKAKVRSPLLRIPPPAQCPRHSPVPLSADSRRRMTKFTGG